MKKPSDSQGDAIVTQLSLFDPEPITRRNVVILDDFKMTRRQGVSYWLLNSKARDIHCSIIGELKEYIICDQEVTPRIAPGPQQGLLELIISSMKGQSGLKNLLWHLRFSKRNGKYWFPRYWLKADIKNAFGNIEKKQLMQLLEDNHVCLSLVKDIGKYCFVPEGGLIIGGNASPLLFDTYCSLLIDKEVRELAKTYNLVYTRYCDDLLFSSYSPIGRKKRKRIMKVIQEKAGLPINCEKTKLIDLAKTPLHVYGYCIQFHAEKKTFSLSLSQSYMRQLRGLLWQAVSRPGTVKQNRVLGKMSPFFFLSRVKDSASRIEKDISGLWTEYLKKIYMNEEFLPF